MVKLNGCVLRVPVVSPVGLGETEGGGVIVDDASVDCVDDIDGPDRVHDIVVLEDPVMDLNEPLRCWESVGVTDQVNVCEGVVDVVRVSDLSFVELWDDDGVGLNVASFVSVGRETLVVEDLLMDRSSDWEREMELDRVKDASREEVPTLSDDEVDCDWLMSAL
jgi:hypothetical protein